MTGTLSLKPDEDPAIFFHDQNLAPTGWEEKHGRSYCIDREIYAVEIREWIHLDSPCPEPDTEPHFIPMRITPHISPSSSSPSSSLENQERQKIHIFLCK